MILLKVIIYKIYITFFSDFQTVVFQMAPYLSATRESKLKEPRKIQNLFCPARLFQSMIIPIGLILIVQN